VSPAVRAMLARYRPGPEDGDESAWPLGANPHIRYERQTARQRAAWEANRDALGLPAPSRYSRWADPCGATVRTRLNRARKRPAD